MSKKRSIQNNSEYEESAIYADGLDEQNDTQEVAVEEDDLEDEEYLTFRNSTFFLPNENVMQFGKVTQANPYTKDNQKRFMLGILLKDGETEFLSSYILPLTGIVGDCINNTFDKVKPKDLIGYDVKFKVSSFTSKGKKHSNIIYLKFIL